MKDETELQDTFETEQKLLGCILKDQEVLPDIMEIIQEDYFQYGRHRVVYRAILDLWQQYGDFDDAAVWGLLYKRGQTQKFDEATKGQGFSYFFDSFVKEVTGSAHATYHAKELRQIYQKRQAWIISTEFLKDIPGAEDLSNLVTELNDNLNELTEASQGHVATAAEAAMEAYNIAEARAKGERPVGTGLKTLDEMIIGFEKGEFVLIGGRPSMGKTALAWQICEWICNTGKWALFFSMEMPRAALLQRAMSRKAQVAQDAIRCGVMDKDEWKRLADSLSEYERLPLHIDDTSSQTVGSLRAVSRKYASQKKLNIIFIDYLQLMPGKEESRQQQVTAISRGLKGLARELNVPVICLSQLNRRVEERTDKKPRSSDLRESGSLEQDADLVMLLYREDLYRDNPDDYDHIAQVHVTKQRNGRTGWVSLEFFEKWTEFGDLENET